MDQHQHGSSSVLFHTKSMILMCETAVWSAASTRTACSPESKVGEPDVGHLNKE